MKRLIIVMIVLLTLPLVAGQYKLKDIIIGKWDLFVMDGTSMEKSAQLIFDSEVFVSYGDNDMTSQPYSIKDNKFCTKDRGVYKCKKVIFISKNEFIIPDDKIKLIRVKE